MGTLYISIGLLFKINAIDTIFSTRSLGSGDPSWPSGTVAAGYAMDSWEKWRIVCLAALSVDDIEDVYIFGAIVTGVSLIGLGFALVFRQIQGSVAVAQSSHWDVKKLVVAVQGPSMLPAMIKGLGKAVGTQAGTMNRYMDNIVEVNRKLDGIMGKLTALQRPNRDHIGQIQ